MTRQPADRTPKARASGRSKAAPRDDGAGVRRGAGAAGKLAAPERVALAAYLGH